jgi:hypothetical protein
LQKRCHPPARRRGLHIVRNVIAHSFRRSSFAQKGTVLVALPTGDIQIVNVLQMEKIR